MTFGTEKLEWCGDPMVKNFEDISIHFDRIHERVRHSDTQTPHDGQGNKTPNVRHTTHNHVRHRLHND